MLTYVLPNNFKGEGGRGDYDKGCSECPPPPPKHPYNLYRRGKFVIAM